MPKQNKKNKNRLYIKKYCGGIHGHSNTFDTCNYETCIRSDCISKLLKWFEYDDFVLTELSVNVGPCFDENSKFFDHGSINIADANEYLKKARTLKQSDNFVTKYRNNKSYLSSESVHSENINLKTVKYDCGKVNRLIRNKSKINTNQSKVNQLQIMLTDNAKDDKMENDITKSENEAKSELSEKASETLIPDIDTKVSTLCKSNIESKKKSSKHESAAEYLENKDETPDNQNKTEPLNVSNKIKKENATRQEPCLEKVTRIDISIGSESDEVKLKTSDKSANQDSIDERHKNIQNESNTVQNLKDNLDKRKTEPSSTSKITKEGNLKSNKNTFSRKKYTDAKDIREQIIKSRKTKINLRNDGSNKYVNSSMKKISNYKSQLGRHASVTDKINLTSKNTKGISKLKHNRSSVTESRRMARKGILKIFMTSSHSSFDSDATSQSDNENSTSSTVRKVHNTRKTHPSYAKIRVKSQEALGVRNTNKSKGTAASQDSKIDYVSDAGSVILEKDPLALDPPKEDSPPVVQKRSRGRPALNKKRKLENDTSPSTSQPSTKRTYKSGGKEVKQCRLCGELAADYLDVFSESATDMQLIEKIKEYLVINILKDDVFSKYACLECTTMIVNWANFYQRCRDVDKQYLSKQSGVLSSEMINNKKNKTKDDSGKDFLLKESDTEDNIEKMLREMHGMDKDEGDSEKNHKETSAELDKEKTNMHSDIFEDTDMDVEFLDEERDLVDEALLYQRMKVNEKTQLESKTDTSSKIIRMDRKLTEQELRSLMTKHNASSNSVVVLKVDAKQNLNNEDIQNTLKELKERCQNSQDRKSIVADDKIDKEYYVNLARSYAHRHLESIQTVTETHYKCPDCRDYVAASQMPKHCIRKHGKMNALCDFCCLLLPYDSDEHKLLVKEHIELHSSKKSKTHPDVILNTSKLLQSVLQMKNESISKKKSEVGKEDSNNKIIDLDESPDIIDITLDEDTPVEKRRQNRYRCKICHQKFSTVSLLRDHNMVQHTSIKLECETCFEMFSTRQNLVNHVKLKHSGPTEKTQWVCEMCGQSFEKQDEYIQHKITDHNISKPEVFVCLHCEKRYKSIENLREHVRTHKSLLCEICGETFKTRLAVRSHKRNVHNINMHPCPHCDYVAVSSARLKIHIRLHNAFAAFSCEQCDASFYTTKRLRDHIQHQHIDQKDVRKYECPLCDWMFHVEVNLKKHFEIHVEKGHVVCKVCQEKFEQAGDTLDMNDVIQHKEKHTEQENMVFKRPYSPSVSRLKCWSNGTPGARAVCRDCGLTFSTPNELRKHHKIHKPFYCEICKTLSNNEQTYNQHMDQHSERKHGCKTCGKMFMTRPALGLHMRTHVKEPKHQCKVCQRKFLLTADWRRHERSCRAKYGWPNPGDLGSSYKVNYKKNTVSQQYTIIDKIKTVMTEDGQQILYECTPEEVLEDTTNEGVFQHLTTDEGKIHPDDFVQLVIENDESNNIDADETIEIDESELMAFREWQKATAHKDCDKSKKHLVQDIVDRYIIPDRTYIYQSQSDNGNENKTQIEQLHAINIENSNTSHTVISTGYNKSINGVDKDNLHSNIDQSEENVIFTEPQYMLEADGTQIIIPQNTHLSNENYVFSNDIDSQEIILNEETEEIILKQENENVHVFNQINTESSSKENLESVKTQGETIQCFDNQDIVFDTTGNDEQKNSFEKDQRELMIEGENSFSNDVQNQDSATVSYVMKNQDDSKSQSSVTTIYLQESSIVDTEMANESDQVCEIQTDSDSNIIGDSNYTVIDN